MKVVVASRFFSAYAPQTGCSDQAKDEFWNLLDEKTAEVPSKDVIIVAGDLNGHIVATKGGYSCHGGFGYGSRNADDCDRSLVTDAKIVPYETVAPQHRSLICTLKMASPRLMQVERCGADRIKWWRMREKEAAVIFRVRLPTVTTVDETWKRATDSIRQAAQSELGTLIPSGPSSNLIGLCCVVLPSLRLLLFPFSCSKLALPDIVDMSSESGC
ncbi:unnamed protein product [Heligmosomoides polygyrus]|uniref:Endo/exonuclease/phosphatase domain-containing protein n=1 Tax=Heligmosomoides polygyrus TaxID=6339 RepID=A0A183FKW2_HELPZ|nr:unnamed protein product [Heligmosomoides polygyrus]